ncbi:gp53-like domain-containing protein [Xenorhabdus bovienii]|uniref:gp53-like domain-containing protein n=1 Tax=Xenorhabdus bovienii TaxID=40576 RepID=UPI0023B26E4F|nr:hypothetical protein [Xenorhabdus bovienii]MDE9545408.1 hypothetical protein [Xenorhabdus bovienii]
MNNNIALKSKNGWWKCGSTGITYQWGTINRATDQTNVDFPTLFSTACFNVQLTLASTNGSSQINIVAQSLSTSGFTYQGYSAEKEAYWFAIGY